MIKAKNITMKERIWINRVASTKIHLLLEGGPVPEFLEELRLKDLVKEFVALTTSESVSRYTRYEHNDVCPTMCGMVLKHVGTHEYVDQSFVDAVD